MELAGKTVNFLGDSITEGYGVQDPAVNRYDVVAQKLYNLKKVNTYGIGGSRIAHQVHPSENARWDLDFCGRAQCMEPDADAVVVFGGVNDYIHGDAPFGRLTDSTRETFCGSVAYLARVIRQQYPNAVLVFAAPAHCSGDAQASKSVYRTTEGRPLAEYIDAICWIVPQYGFHVLKMSEQLGIDPNNEEERNAFASDGLHFNAAGHVKIAQTIGDFLKSI